MSTLKEKERLKDQQEKFQAILSALLKDEDNKYCVDCDAKGPRWASWNLGIFLCIRCAGIHRNLGVHISKVKSVNLDSWTPEQVAMMQEIGNSRGRAVYEANIPDGFRRPQSDSALEAFIRSKYEQKKYIAREWIPPQPRVPKEWIEDTKADKKKARTKPAGGSIQLSAVPKPAATTPPSETAKPKPEVKVQVKAEPASNSASNDLLGLEATQAPPTSGGNELLDLFGGPQVSSAPSNQAPAQAGGNDLMNGTSSEANLFGDDKSGGGGEEKKASTKDSIMALYGGGGGGGGPSQPQVYGVPGSGQPYYTYQQYGGVYMSQAQSMYPGVMGQQGMMGVQAQAGMPQQAAQMPQQQGMMGPQMGMMGQQGMMPQGMMGNMGMNGPQQMGMYNGQMMQGNQGAMYSPQQMQQLQFQQMQQQMSAMKVSGSQPGQMPAASSAAGWGNPGPGHTLSTNLWQ